MSYRLVLIIFLLSGCGYVDKAVYDQGVKKRLELQADVERFRDILQEQDAQLRIMMEATMYDSRSLNEHTQFKMEWLEVRLSEHTH